MRKTLLYDEVVSIETAALAKTAGFDVDSKVCSLYYCEFEGQVIIAPDPCPKLCRIICMAPTQPLLQRWLREEKGIHISVEYEWVEGIDDWTFYAYIKKVNNAKVVDDAIKSGFNTYELALEDALKYALENLVLL